MRLRSCKGGSRTSVFDRAVLNRGHIARKFGGAPPIGVALKHGQLVRRAAGQFERAGAIGIAGGEVFFVGRVVLRLNDTVLNGPSFVDHKQRGQLVGQDRICALGGQMHGQIVNGFDQNDRGHLLFKIRSLALGAIDRKDHIGGGEILPAVEFHALAQLKFPFGRLNRLPAHRQLRHKGQIRIAVHQTLVNRAVHGNGGAFVLAMRIERERARTRRRP